MISETTIVIIIFIINVNFKKLEKRFVQQRRNDVMYFEENSNSCSKRHKIIETRLAII